MASMGPGSKTRRPLTAGAKTIKCEHLNSISQPADIGKAPPSRIYSNDYSKVQEAGDKDVMTQYLGNPLRW